MAVSRWVDEVWWRDWVFWVGAAAAAADLVIRLAADDSPWWWNVLRCCGAFVGVVVVLGFVRTAVRSYRGTPAEE